MFSHRPKVLATSLSILACCILVKAAALQNITLLLPEGTSNHGDPGLLCTSTRWIDVLIFFAGNYFAHAATIVSIPGESTWQFAVRVFLALLVPTSGIVVGINAIRSLAKLAKTDLQTAARAGALGMVVRSIHWKPEVGDVISNAILTRPDDMLETDLESPKIFPRMAVFSGSRNNSYADPDIFTDRKIHGLCHLPDGYMLARVPRDASLIGEAGPAAVSMNQSSISCSYSLLKTVVAIVQTIYASVTLYQARGDQISRYGFAAFGLSVAPFFVMSVVNLIGNLMVPDYPKIYLVESSVMKEAQKRKGGKFDGMVGRLQESVDCELSSGCKSAHWVNGSLKFEQSERADHVEAVAEIAPDKLFPTTDLSLGGSIPSLSPPLQEMTDLSQRNQRFIVSVPKNAVPLSPSAEADGITNMISIPSFPPLTSRLKYNNLIPSYKIIQISENMVKMKTNLERDDRVYFWWFITMIYMNSAAPVAIIGGLSKLQTGSNTYDQTLWMSAWLIIGILCGIAAGSAVLHDSVHKVKIMLIYLLFAGIAIGGFVVVGQMLFEYGTCFQVG